MYGYGHHTAHYQNEAHNADGGRVRSTFENAMVAHVWAQQSQDFGKSGNGNFYFRGQTIFSYGEHFPIAKFTGRVVDGREVVLFTCNSYSPSTNRHIQLTQNALHGLSGVVVAYVPDLSRWHDDARTHASVIEAFARRIGEGRGNIASAEVYRRAFKVRKRLPADCAAFVADEKAKAKRERESEALADARRFAKRINARRPLESLGIMPVPTRDAGDNPVERRVETNEQIARIAGAQSCAGKARHWFGRLGGSKRDRAAVSAALKALKPAKESWLEYGRKVRAFEHRADIARRVDALACRIAAGSEDTRNHWNPEILISEMQALGIINAPVMAFLCRAASINHALSEIPANCGRPSWWYDRLSQRSRITADEWLAGKPGAFYQDAPTLVRRKGDRLETSRGADAPFEQAAAIYLKATACRASGRTWRRNGERMRAGAFELDSIDASGGIRIGCHRIGFEEMERLAVAEIPERVKARFPVPAVVAS
ncbi:hypothetical protein [Amorphus sp. MBR-141]